MGGDFFKLKSHAGDFRMEIIFGEYDTVTYNYLKENLLLFYVYCCPNIKIYKILKAYIYVEC